MPSSLSRKVPAMIVIRQVVEPEQALIPSLCELLIDTVHNGASVGFLAPLSVDRAARYWEQVFASLGAGLLLWVAEEEGNVAGSVQLAPSQKENGRHRAEIQKLFVLSAFRGQGIASRLMSAAEMAARAGDRTLLVLDTLAGSGAEAVYRHLGWQRAGEIPNYAASPDGQLHATVYYYKLLAPESTGAPTTALDLSQLWDFSQPALSEQRFRTALATASGDDALILQTQIARTFGLRRDFVAAQATLDSIENQVAGAGGEVRVRHALEQGRALSSATHPPESQTEAVKAAARAAYLAAFALAQAEKLDGLAIDALHMLAFVDTDPVDQVNWGLQALSVMEQSSQPAARQWEGSLRNNVGYALHQQGRYEEALAQFELALAFRQRTGNAEQARIATWMVAWTLRSLGRLDEALGMQLRLEEECAAAGAPDPYVFEELELLYHARNDAVRAAEYAERCQKLQ